MDNNIIYTPYLYHISWSHLNMHYIGVEYKNNKKEVAHPNNCWTTYFTSSKYVTQFREEFGEPDIIKIRKTFNTADKALLYETKLLTKINAVELDTFLNKSNGGFGGTKTCPHCGITGNSNIMNRHHFDYCEHAPDEIRKERKRKKQNKLKQIKCPHCPTIGSSSSMKRWHFDKCKLAPDEIRKERPKPKQLTCPHCGKVGDSSNMKHYHFSNCKYKE